MLALQQLPEVWSTADDIDLQNRLNQLPFYAPAGFGDTASDIQTILQKAPDVLSQIISIMNKAGNYLPTIEQVLEDPAFPQLVQRVQTMQALQQQGTATPATPGAPAATQGAGLSQVLPIWDIAIWYTKYPWAPWAIGAGTVLVLVGLGVGIGRRKCRTSAGVGRRYRRR